MKVIFTDDVPNVARVGQTKEVADGYARNYLFPRKLAVLANSQAAAAIDAHLKKLIKQRAVEEAQMAELAKKINGLQITLKAKVGENDRLYGSITSADIAEALSKAAGCLIDKKNVALPEPIKQAGVCDVTIKFMREITAMIKANVVDENATEEEIAARAEKAAREKAEAKAKAEAKKEKAEKPEAASAPEEEKAEKKARKAKAEKPPKEEEKTAEAQPAEAKAEKPAREKKAKAEKTAKEETAEKTEAKKEKKPRAKAKKEDAAAE